MTFESVIAYLGMLNVCVPGRGLQREVRHSTSEKHATLVTSWRFLPWQITQEEVHRLFSVAHSIGVREECYGILNYPCTNVGRHANFLSILTLLLYHSPFSLSLSLHDLSQGAIFPLQNYPKTISPAKLMIIYVS